MIYLALGDSISIDDYTGVPRGGAASQFARLVNADVFENRAADGCTTDGVLDTLERVTARPDVVTVTAGGNDFMLIAAWLTGHQTRPTMEDWEKVVQPALANLRAICDRLAGYGCPVILNTVYDVTDGVDELAVELGIAPDFRPSYNALNEGIRALAAEHGFMLSDLEMLFRGHGIVSPDPWITHYVEPNYAGATAIARHWLALYQSRS